MDPLDELAAARAAALDTATRRMRRLVERLELVVGMAAAFEEAIDWTVFPLDDLMQTNEALRLVNGEVGDVGKNLAMMGLLASRVAERQPRG